MSACDRYKYKVKRMALRLKSQRTIWHAQALVYRSTGLLMFQFKRNLNRIEKLAPKPLDLLSKEKKHLKRQRLLDKANIFLPYLRYHKYTSASNLLFAYLCRNQHYSEAMECILMGAIPSSDTLEMVVYRWPQTETVEFLTLGITSYAQAQRLAAIADQNNKPALALIIRNLEVYQGKSRFIEQTG